MYTVAWNIHTHAHKYTCTNTHMQREREKEGRVRHTHKHRRTHRVKIPWLLDNKESTLSHGKFSQSEHTHKERENRRSHNWPGARGIGQGWYHPRGQRLREATPHPGDQAHGWLWVQETP